ncbi:carbamoyl-phosphate synthase (glutamine-hydrolyzing) large subunit [Desmospora activa]|uniref:Carbamoyl phosphate synthase large chain n=1 Tax=Desmospora activa DSM 45169 TaxID=1121389 RepID=A0A2T4Z450_9BACL|nr:carbamoyl-phosphate synthase (glutamine-hydrolyzing) large subunit [Desmospora activa]PTM56681.1 carbamoyl-phosphate synthase large subunit [Desmospora activa DSM 45169]
MGKMDGIQSVLVIGSGPIVIGQAAEFDYSGTQACLALKEEGIRVILVNHNPATIMTDPDIADVIYMEPQTSEVLTRIIERERPDALLANMGGQTGLNLAMELEERGVLERFGVCLLGTPVETIRRGEDREAFKQMMEALGEPVPQGQTVTTVEEALVFAEKVGYPVVVRPAYTLGGFGGGAAENPVKLAQVARRGLAASPIGQVLVEESILGWKELEYEMMRDQADTCIAVCNMENIDPVGVHTGDSMVTAPSQTLTDQQYHMLRTVACDVIRALEVVGGCNIQFALHPETGEYRIIEVNPRVSRSSALASKATGYPIARLAAKLCLGYRLDECLNPVTGHTFASFEPALDYVVVKLPRWPFDQFPGGERDLGTRMKATGEVMALGRNLETALFKAIRSLDQGCDSLLREQDQTLSDDALATALQHPDDKRLFLLAEAFRRGWSVERVHTLTAITPYYLHKIAGMTELELTLAKESWESVSNARLQQAKQWGVADSLLARLWQVEEKTIRKRLLQLGESPAYKWVDTCAGEFVAATPYYYSSWQGADEVTVDESRPRALVVGSGPIRIGQGIEFDYCSVHAAKSLQQRNWCAVVVNNNPETVSTDFATADRLYFEPLTVEDVVHVARKEQVEGVLVQFGGQTAIQLIKGLEEAGIPVWGTTSDIIDHVEDRHRFYQFLERLDIPHIPGETATSAAEALQVGEKLGYPLLVRPSYVIGGRGMQVVGSQEELAVLLEETCNNAGSERLFPLLLDRFLEGMEVEVDAVTDGRDVSIPTLVQHVERAGVHSGDSLAILGAPDLDAKTAQKVVETTTAIATELGHVGLLNIQFVVTEGRVYVLEVNPRASRTVPIISKVTGVPMIDWATRVQMGEKLASFAPLGLLPRPQVWAVKGSVFSTPKLPEVDPALGPRMKSTGEVLGVGHTLEQALAKAVPWTVSGSLPPVAPGSALLLAVADTRKEEVLPLARQLAQAGVSLTATTETAQFLRKKGMDAIVECPPENWEEWFALDCPKAVLNIPTRGEDPKRAGFRLRQLTLEWQVPCFTSVDTFQAWLRSNAWIDSTEVEPFQVPRLKELITG